MRGYALQIDARTVFCDDLRREDTGKAILIGVYADDLVPNTLPTQFPLSIWVKVTGLDSGSYPFALRVSFPGADKQAEIRGDIEVKKPNEATSFFLAGLQARVTQPGLIKVELEVDGEIYDAGELLVTEPMTNQTEQVLEVN